MSWVLQYLVGFQRLGHDVYFVEKANYADACYDPTRRSSGNDGTRGLQIVHELLSRFGLGERWCFVDFQGRYHGVSEVQIKELFRTADLFLDMGTHGAWREDAEACRQRVLADGEPGFTQINMVNRRHNGDALPPYDFYVTAGLNFGSADTRSPDAGERWRPLPHPVVTGLFQVIPSPPGAAFTTVMNWQSHEPVYLEGREYGQKNVEFVRFVDLPRRTRVPLEVAVSGKGVPRESLLEHGWRISDAQAVTASFDSFQRYLQASLGEFSVCKNVFVALNTGWFSDRSAAYLASGRPVVVQDTGFSAHLPCGAGLFAVRSVAEAAEAIEDVAADYRRHSLRARQIAEEHLEATRVLKPFLDELGL